MRLSKAIVGFVNHKLANGLTDRSVYLFERILRKWVEHGGDKDIRFGLHWHLFSGGPY